MDKQAKLKKLRELLVKANSIEKGKSIAIAKEILDLNKSLQERKELEKETLVSLIKETIPREELKGDQGPRGEDGRSPLTVSKTPPKNPQKGDLWYQD